MYILLPFAKTGTRIAHSISDEVSLAEHESQNREWRAASRCCCAPDVAELRPRMVCGNAPIDHRPASCPSSEARKELASIACAHLRIRSGFRAVGTAKMWKYSPARSLTNPGSTVASERRRFARARQLHCWDRRTRAQRFRPG